ncbi:hypothetical protein VRU48_08785 [Pedobacter sp. KR3-3]|uniref:Uncharacterized protein n=1 Tax=Pedobacter albus TaxID=3113905 RepID=A0ABU7I785_9SPHI|nr:hypothetical protein [Pedobacter sp. KR3-3]MEE1945201.1 hypothetical protein [Pedobacter sp. KR3-3]
MNIRRYHLMAWLVLLLLACRETPKVAKVAVADTTKTLASMPIEKEELTDSIADDSLNYANYYIVVADTGLSYPKLNLKMKGLAKSLHMQIDMLGRSYNEKENLISLPKNNEDEIYAGEYFPRRIPSESLSLEYLNYYSAEARQKTIALVTGMYAELKQADSALTAVKRINPQAFKFYSKVYIGCMH